MGTAHRRLPLFRVVLSWILKRFASLGPRAPRGGPLCACIVTSTNLRPHFKCSFPAFGVPYQKTRNRSWITSGPLLFWGILRSKEDLRKRFCSQIPTDRFAATRSVSL